jgi:metal-dependent amidase/aminoacylase/carboxypeptidase family protein
VTDNPLSPSSPAHTHTHALSPPPPLLLLPPPPPPRYGYPPTVNHRAQTDRARAVATAVVGEGNVIDDATPTMGSEDFSYVYSQVYYSSNMNGHPKTPECIQWMDGFLPVSLCLFMSLSLSLSSSPLAPLPLPPPPLSLSHLHTHTPHHRCLYRYMLESVPGCYIWLGQGGGPSACALHNPG